MGWPSAHVIALENGDPARYEMTNGRTFFINRILQDSYKSVYYTMADVETHEAYAAFYQLLQGDERVWTYFEEDDDVEPIFDLNATTSSSGLGPIVTSFNNFRYTVLVPTKEALDRLLQKIRNCGLGSRLLPKPMRVRRKKRHFIC